MSKLYLPLLLFILIPLFNLAQEKPSEYSLLWKIKSPGHEKTSYLFGTMHLTDPDVFNLPDSLYHFMSNCDLFATEVDFNGLTKKLIHDAIEKRLYGENQNGGSNYSNLSYSKSYETYKEIKSKKIKDGPKDRPVFLDAYLYNNARKMGKQTVGLEPISNQFNSLNKKFNNSLQIEKKRDKELIYESVKEMIEVYKRGSSKEIHDYTQLFSSKNDIHDLNKRNLDMVNTIDSISSLGLSLFSAVGAAHLAGDSGIVSLLKNRGYQLEVFNGDFSNLSTQLFDSLPNQTWVNYKEERFGYEIKFPSAPFDLDLQTGMDGGKMSFDISNGTGYLTMGLDMPIQSDFDQKKMLDQFVENYKNTYRKIEQKKYIEVKGKKGVQFIGYSGIHAVKTKIFLSGNKVIIFGVLGSEHFIKNENSTSVFFESIKWNKIEKNELGNSSIYSEKGAFSVNYGSNYKYEAKNELYDPKDPESIATTHLWMSNSAKGLIICRYNDQPSGYYFQSDSMTYQANIELFENQLGSKITPIKISHKGIEGRELEYNDGYNLGKVRMFIRGNRMYLFLYQKMLLSNSEDISNDLFNSIEFYKLNRSQKNLKEIEDWKVEVSLPNNYRIVDLNSGEYYVDHESYFAAVSSDSMTGDQIMIEKSDLGKYYYTPSIDSMFKLYYSNSSFDSIYYRNDTVINGYPVLDVIVNSQETSQYTLQRTIINNRYDYTITAGVSNEINDPVSYINEFEFNILEKDTSSSITEPKLKMILNDIYNSDTLISKEAKSGLGNYFPSQSEYSVIVNGLRKESNSTNNQWNSTQRRLLGLLDYIKSDSVISFLKTYYFENDSSSMKSLIMNKIIQKDSLGAIPFLVELIEKNDLPQKEKWSYGSKFWIFHQNADSVLTHPAIIDQLKSNTDYQSERIQLLQYIVEDSSISLQEKVEFLSDYNDELKGTFNEIIKLDSSSYTDKNILYSIATIYSKEGFFDENLLRIMLNHDDIYVAWRALNHLINNKVEIESNQLEKFLSHNTLAGSTLKLLSENNMPSIAPGKYWKRTMLSKILMVEYLNEYEYLDLDVSDLKNEREATVQIDGKKMEYFAYSIDKDDFKIVCIQGAYELKKKYDISEEINNYSFDQYNNNEELNAEIDRLLKQALSWKSK